MKDTIKIKVEERSWEEPEEIWNEGKEDFEETDNNVTKYDIECKVEINGKEIKHYTDLWTFFREFVEKANISNCAEYFGNTYKEVGHELVPITKSWHYNLTTFYPFTCSCGIAGCSSIWDGIHVKWRKNSVEWRIKDKRDGYEKILDKMFYSFDRKQYEKEVLTHNEVSDIITSVKNPDKVLGYTKDFNEICKLFTECLDIRTEGCYDVGDKIGYSGCQYYVLEIGNNAEGNLQEVIIGR